MQYDSSRTVSSTVAPGVRFVIARMSFGRRVELARRIRELGQKIEFLSAGTDPSEKMDAALVTSAIERLYVLWGVREISGLELDGCVATPESLADHGPEELFREALDAVKAECGLSEAERKN